VQAFNKTQTEYETLPERVIRDAIRRALFRGELYDDQPEKGKGKLKNLSFSTASNLRKRNRDKP
jgi:hypothetical protein